MVRFARGAIVVGALLSSACDVDFVSDSGRVGFDVSEFHYSSPARWSSGGPVAAGSRLCLDYEGWYEADLESFHEESLTGCFDVGLSGVGTLDGRCLEVAPGDATVTFTRTGSDCPGGLGDDTLRVRGVALDDTRTVVEFLLESFAVEGGFETPGFDPAALRIPPGEVVPVVEDVDVSLWIGLRTVVDDASVAWTDGRVEGSISSITSPGDEPDPTDVVVRLRPEEAGDLSLVVEDVPAPAASFESVPVTALQGLDVVPFVQVTEDGTPVVFALRALSHDDTGRPVLGVPASWRVVEGEAEIEPLFGTASPDYVGVDVECGAPEQHIVVEAEFGDELARYEWTQASTVCEATGGDTGGDGDTGDDAMADNPDGELGCACSASEGRRGWPLWTMLGVFLGTLRRRRRST